MRWRRIKIWAVDRDAISCSLRRACPAAGHRVRNPDENGRSPGRSTAMTRREPVDAIAALYRRHRRGAMYELPLADELIPFLIARPGRALDRSSAGQESPVPDDPYGPGRLSALGIVPSGGKQWSGRVAQRSCGQLRASRPGARQASHYSCRVTVEEMRQAVDGADAAGPDRAGRSAKGRDRGRDERW